MSKTPDFKKKINASRSSFFRNLPLCHADDADRSRQAEKKEKMHLSNELQKHLKKIGSSIELAKTIDKESPSNYAFYEPQKERNFRVYFGDKKSQFSIVFFERTKEKNYEICHLRGLFNSIIELAKAIKNWTEDENEIEEIANRFSNLEKYQFDDTLI